MVSVQKNICTELLSIQQYCVGLVLLGAIAPIRITYKDVDITTLEYIEAYFQQKIVAKDEVHNTPSYIALKSQHSVIIIKLKEN